MNGVEPPAKKKTDWRSRLRDDRVTDILTVMLETPGEEQFDPTEAVHLWNVSCCQRMDQPSAESHQTEAPEEQDEDVEEHLRIALKRLENLSQEDEDIFD